MPRQEDEAIARLREVNRLLQDALDKCQAMLTGERVAARSTGQDNEPPRHRRDRD